MAQIRPFGQETALQENLVTLRTKLLIMCASVSAALENSTMALAELDFGRAQSVIEGDSSINALENEIDALALKTLACGQPFAKDLRAVVTALRMVVELERIADEAAEIAEQSILIRDCDPQGVGEELLEFLKKATQAYDIAYDCFRTSDIEKAQQLAGTDAEATQDEVILLKQLLDVFGEGRINSSRFMHLTLIIRSGTRIRRRAANIAGHVWFEAKGKSLKHGVEY